MRDSADLADVARLLCSDGSSIVLDVRRWLDDPATEEREALDRAMPPVLDIGCGPGRHALALAARGAAALGIDVAPAAVSLARGRGAMAMRRSVFARVPGAGRWRSALLLDGNIGIGGDPVRLLRRVAALLTAGGQSLVELQAPGTGTRSVSACVQRGSARSAWFPWSVVAVDDVYGFAAGSGFRVEEVWDRRGRWFASLALR